MGKVTFLKAVFKAVLSTCLTISLTTAPVFAAAKSAAATKAPKVRPGGLGLLTFAQIAQLPDRMRREYISVFRGAVAELETQQNAFGRTYGKFSASKDSDLYASAPSDFYNWLIETAEAQSASEVSQNCIHGGNISGYPPGKRPSNAGGVRVIGQCEPINCSLGGRSERNTRQNPNAVGLKGYKCGFIVSGLVNRPGRGCQEVSIVDNARFTHKCEERRLQLAGENRAATASLVTEANNYFGFKPGGTYRADTCKSEGSKRLMNRLIESSYDDDAFGLLIKTAYFCKSNGQGLPDGLTPFDAGDSPFKLENLEGELNGMTNAVENMYRGFSVHCPSLIPAADKRDLLAKCQQFNATRSAPGADDGVIRGIARGTPLYAQEANRINKACRVGANGAFRHDNVLEVEECQSYTLRRDALRAKVGEIAGTLPQLEATAPPQPMPNDGLYEPVKIFPTGCTEAVTREGAKLAQASARCMPCLEQTTQNIKDRKSSDPNVRAQAGAFRGSRKYRSLISTMALACGDGMLRDSTVTVEMQVDYLHAFGYCASDKYEWDNSRMDSNQERLVMTWGDQQYWKKADPKRDNPERNNNFKKVYGIDYDNAKDMFCAPGNRGGLRGRPGYTPSEKRDLLRSRRASFEKGREKFGNGKDSDYSGGLADCMTEASANAADFNRDSNLCIGFESFQRGRSPAETKMREGFLEDPAIADFAGDCAIPKQMEEYHTQDIGGSISVCSDANRDGKDDATQAPCSTGDARQCLSWINPRDATPYGAEYQPYRCLPQTRNQTSATFKDSGEGVATARFTYRDGGSCDIGSNDTRRAAPAQRNGGAQ